MRSDYYHQKHIVDVYIGEDPEDAIWDDDELLPLTKAVRHPAQMVEGKWSADLSALSRLFETEHVAPQHRLKQSLQQRYLDSGKSGIRQQQRRSEISFSLEEFGAFSAVLSLLGAIAGMSGSLLNVVAVGLIGVMGGFTFMLMGRASRR